jgi:hypothetical protein
MSIVGALSIIRGNPLRLIAPINDQGSLCGVSSDVASSPVWYQVSTWGQGVCLPSCPTARRPLPVTSLSHTDYVCLSWVQKLFGFTNTDGNALANVAFQAYLQTACMSGGVFSPWGRVNPDLGACGCNLIYPTAPVFNRCLFTNSTQRVQFNQASFQPDYFVGFMGDIVTARFLIFAFGFLLAVFLSFCFSHVLRFERLGLFAVWGGVGSTVCAAGALVGVCWWRAGQWSQEVTPLHSTTARLALQAFSLVVMSLAALFLCACIFLRRSINLAVRATALSAAAAEDMALLVFTPLLHVLGFAGLVVPVVFYGLYVASSGTLTQLTTVCYPPLDAAGNVVAGAACLPRSNALTSAQLRLGVTVTTGYTYGLDTYAAGEQLWFLFFCLLWTMNFIAGVGTLVVATSVAAWYFTVPEERAALGSRTVLWAYGVVLQFHLGTAACGGLVLAFVQFARWAALYVEKHCKEVQTNLVARLVCCCVDCCLCLLEKFLKFASRQAYVQTAIHGTSFCTGAKDAFFTLSRHVFSVGAVGAVTGMALVVGKVFVTCVSGVASYMFFQAYFPTQMNDHVAPTVLVMILAWMTASLFAEVFLTAADTVLMCYITDAEQHGGQPQYATQDVADFLAEFGALTADHKRLVEAGPGAVAGAGEKDDSKLDRVVTV